MQKNYSLFALLAAAALCSCGGESKNESAAPAEEPVAWSVESMFLANEVAKSKEVTNYGENDQIVSVDKYSIDKATKAETLTEHVIYQNGKAAYSNVFETDGTIIGHSKFTYNEAGDIVSEEIENYVESLKRIALTKRYAYEYNENGDVKVVKEQNAAPNGGWTNDYEWVYTYDAQGRITMRQDFNYKGKDRKQSCQYGYTYKEGSNQLDIVDYLFYDLKTSRLRHDSKTHYTYDKNGRVKSELVERHKANAKRDLVNSRLFTYNYNEAGQLSSSIEQKWFATDKKWQDVRTYELLYSEEGQLLSRVEAFYSNRGLRINKDVYSPAPAGRKLVAPAAPVESVKPVVDVDDKHKTDKNEED